MSNVAYRSFQSGELSPAMYARTDLQRYATGLRTLRNATVLRTGGVQSRAGFEYLGSTKADGAARLVEAVFDTTANYVLEFGNLYVRFWKDGDPIVITTPAAWLTATAYTVGTLRSNGGTNYLCLIAHTSGTFATDLAAGKWYALTGLIYEWPTPYTTAQLKDLQFAYQLNVVTIAHSAHPLATLTRTTDTAWALADVEFALTNEAVSNIAVSGTAGSGWGYTVMAEFGTGYNVRVGPTVAIVRTNNTQSTLTGLVAHLLANPRTITWDAVTDATGYTIYLNSAVGDVLYSKRVGAITTYVDYGNWASLSYSVYSYYTSQLEASAPMSSSGEYPGIIGAYQQRLLVSGSVNNPDVVRASSASDPYDFYGSDPIVDSDAMEWRQLGRRLNRVRHFAEVAQRLFQFSDIGESVVQGDTDGVLRPGEVNPRQFSENGAAAYPSPLIINDTALYVQARGSIVRDLAPAQFDGFTGSDLTLQAAHLVDGLRLVGWCYQQTPNSVVWAVRDDGVLLSLTYVRELGILGWATHDTDGFVESVCCVPEGSVDSVYAVIRRVVNGNTKRFVERMSDRLATNLVLMDSAVTVTASAVDAVNVVVSNGSVIGVPPNAVAVIGIAFSTTSAFVCPTVGEQISLTYLGNTTTWTCTSTVAGFDFTSTGTNAETLALAAGLPTEITILPADWAKVGTWSGVVVAHLVAESVSAVVDGVVAASPNNTAYTAVTVNAAGVVDLGAAITTSATVGLPYTTDIQTLDIDSVGTTIKDRGVQVGGVICWVEDTGKFYAGPIVPTGDTLTGLEAFVPTNDQGYATTSNVTGVAEVTLQATYNNSGRVLIRQVDPTPLTILSIAPTGFLNGGR